MFEIPLEIRMLMDYLDALDMQKPLDEPADEKEE